jgi:hypothetical protein
MKQSPILRTTLGTVVAATAAVTAIVVIDGHTQTSAEATHAITGQVALTGRQRHRDLKLTVVFDPRAGHSTDVRPKGPSAGDTFVYSATIKHGTRVIGRLEGVTIAADTRYQGDVSTQYFVLKHGTVAVVGGGQSGAPGVGRPDSKIFDAVVGGTGDYTGAGGWVTARDVDDRTELLNLHLR